LEPLGSSDNNLDNRRPRTPASPPPVGPRRTAGPPATGPSAAARQDTREIPTLAARLTPALSLPVEIMLSANVMEEEVEEEEESHSMLSSLTPEFPQGTEPSVSVHLVILETPS